jgi:hypothetical protein
MAGQRARGNSRWPEASRRCFRACDVVLVLEDFRRKGEHSLQGFGCQARIGLEQVLGSPAVGQTIQNELNRESSALKRWLPD